MTDPTYGDQLSAEQRAALTRHGYEPDAAPRGISGGPGNFDRMGWIDGKFVPIGRMRNRVCYLDGIAIGSHEASDLDPGGGCLHCGKEWSEIAVLDHWYDEDDEAAT